MESSSGELLEDEDMGVVWSIVGKKKGGGTERISKGMVSGKQALEDEEE